MKYLENLCSGVLIATLVNAFVSQSWPAAALVLVSALLYAQERHERALQESNPVVDLTSVYSTIEMLGTRLDKMQKNQDEVNKIANDTKRLLNETNLNVAFRPRLAKKD